MEKRDVRTAFQSALAESLGIRGFSKVNRGDGFSRRIPGGSQRIGFAVVDLRPQLFLAPTISVRLDAVEDILHQFSGALPQYRKLSHTMSVPFEYFTTGGLRECSVSTEDDVAKSAALLAPVLLDKVIPFLDVHKDVRSVSHAMNHADARIDNSDQPYLAMHAVIAAKMSSDPDFDSLVETYRVQLAAVSPSLLDKYDPLVRHLRSCV